MWVDSVGLLSFKSWRSLLALTASLLGKGSAEAATSYRKGPAERSAVDRSHRLDLDQRVRDRQVRDLHQCARRWVRPEELRAHLAVRLAVAHVGDEHGDLDDIVHLAAPGLDDHL